jgi:hypothetical protein
VGTPLKQWIKQLRLILSAGQATVAESGKSAKSDDSPENRMRSIYGKPNRWTRVYDRPAYLRRAKIVELTRFA